tara:strand:+ start:272 stop:1303 length:1032 start_codon:yes stop_codon:yes gene_type:complete
MNKLNYLRTALVLLFVAMVSACSSSNDTNTPTSEVSIRFSDAPVDNLDVVMITVDKLIFNRSGEDIVVDTFANEADTFQLNLLEYQGLESSLVLDSVTLPVGDYQNLRIVILQNEDTYVMEKGNDTPIKLKVPSGKLKLGGFTVSETSSQTFIIEFGLRQAMTYNPTKKERYILKPRGVRIVRLEAASSISGTVEFSAANCLATEGLSHVAYLYTGHSLAPSLLGDVFVREADIEASEDNEAGTDYDADAEDNIITPVVATSIDLVEGEYNYLFSYLKEGDYTVAISCNAAEDNPNLYDDISIPNPTGLIVELSLAKESDRVCDFIEGFAVESCSEKMVVETK